MSLDLTPIKERLEKATKGPWWTAPNRRFPKHVAVEAAAITGGGCVCLMPEALSDNRAANAALIASAPTDIAALVEEVERLRRALQALRMQALQAPDLLATEWGREALEMAEAAFPVSAAIPARAPLGRDDQ